MKKWTFGVLQVCCFAMLVLTGYAFGQSCDSSSCSVGESALRIATAPARFVVQSAPMVAQIAVAPVHAVSGAYQQALASAQYRAANRIHGHTHLDAHTTSGVGWATNDSSPTTCFGRGGDGYAVAQGADGFYATKIAGGSSSVSRSTVRVRTGRIFRR